MFWKVPDLLQVRVQGLGSSGEAEASRSLACYEECVLIKLYFEAFAWWLPTRKVDSEFCVLHPA